jgi:hypothetical protein
MGSVHDLFAEMGLIFLYLAFVLPHNISRHVRSTNKFKMSAFGSLSASKRARTNHAFSRKAGLPSISTLDVRTGWLQWRTAFHWRGHNKIEYTLEASLR